MVEDFMSGSFNDHFLNSPTFLKSFLQHYILKAERVK